MAWEISLQPNMMRPCSPAGLKMMFLPQSMPGSFIPVINEIGFLYDDTYKLYDDNKLIINGQCRDAHCDKLSERVQGFGYNFQFEWRTSPGEFRQFNVTIKVTSRDDIKKYKELVNWLGSNEICRFPENCQERIFKRTSDYIVPLLDARPPFDPKFQFVESYKRYASNPEGRSVLKGAFPLPLSFFETLSAGVHSESFGSPSGDDSDPQLESPKYSMGF